MAKCANNITVGVVLLAAGLSTRMGKNKCLLPWKEQTVLETVAEAFVDCIPKVAVVGHDYNLMEPLLANHNFEVQHNLYPEDGQAVSLRIGIEACLEEAVLLEVAEDITENRYKRKVVIDEDTKYESLDGVICAVADQPLLTKDVVQCLLDCFSLISVEDRHKAIILPIYGKAKTPGNPVLFGAHWIKALLDLEGDVGGKAIIKGEGAQHVIQVPISDENIGKDIDTPESYKKLFELWG